MRIAFVISDLFHMGAQYATALMVRGFIAKGYDVDLLLSQYHVDKLNEGGTPYEIPASTNVIYLKHHRARHNVMELRRYLKHTDADRIICMDPLNMIALRIAAIGVPCKGKLYFVEHGIAGIKDDGRVVPPKMLSPKWLFNKWYYSKFSGCLAVCKACVEDCWKVYNWKSEKIHLVYNPVIDEVFSWKIRDAPKHPWLVKKDFPTFITAGAHHPIKGHLFLMRVFKKLNQEVKARLIVYGVGGMTQQYLDYIKDNHLEDVISVPGYCNNLPAEMKASDAYICSSQSESFSLTLVEALASGTRAISVDCDYGPREVLAGGKYGVLVPVGDEEAMVNAIKTAIDGTGVAPNDGWKEFTLEAAVDRYERGLGLT